MPIFSSCDKTPEWCELESFRFIALEPDQTETISRSAEKEEIIVCSGMVEARSGDVSCRLPEGHKMDLHSVDAKGFSIRAVYGSALVFHASGHWGSVTSSGLFAVTTGIPPTVDTPYDYEKTTPFDNHYHDCDEYWMIYEGRCRVVSEGRFYDVGPGECVATGMGWHHDVQCVYGDKVVKAIYIEGTLEGNMREGHLWEPAHGKAEPRTDRV